MAVSAGSVAVGLLVVMNGASSDDIEWSLENLENWVLETQGQCFVFDHLLRGRQKGEVRIFIKYGKY